MIWLLADQEFVCRAVSMIHVVQCYGYNVLFDVSLVFFLQETYPQTPPIWFSESDDISVSVIIEKLSDTSKKNYNVGSRHLFIILY